MSDTLLSVTPADHAERPRPAPEGRRPGVTLVLAAVLHAAVIAAAIIHFPGPDRTLEPEIIPVEIVQLPEEQPQPEPEQQPPPEPEPQPEEQQAQAPQISRSSGASDDPQREAGQTQRAETEAEPRAPEPQEAPETSELPPELTLGPSPDQEVLEEMAKMREAFDMSALERTGSLESAGQGQGGGDPYLNGMRDRIVANITYPAGAAGGRTGMATFRAVVTRSGRLAKLDLVKSAGTAVLDEAGFDAIRAAEPFQPLPAYIPGEQAIITIVLNIAP